MSENGFDTGVIADDFPTPILGVSADMTALLWANQSAQAWLGKSLQFLEGKRLASLFENFDAVMNIGIRCQRDFAPVSLHGFQIKQPGKAPQRGDITAFPSSDHVVFHLQILGAQPNHRRENGDAISAMGRMLAHEIKNPLAGIDGAAQLLMDDIDDKEGLALIDLIRSEINRIRRLADRMERLGDHDPDNSGLVNIHEVMTKARLVVQSAAPSMVTFEEHYDPSLPPALGDADTLMQAILNLIKNAAESIESGGAPGVITLSTSFRRGVMRQSRETGGMVQLPIEIRISDTGPGISQNVQARIFDPFITNKPTGQGLGLALVSKVASAHGGLVEQKSRAGQTVFSILLPLPERDSHEV